MQTKPDFILINESGKDNGKICKNCPDYGSYYSNDRLAIFYNKSISVTPIMRDTWDSIFMAVKISLTGKSMVLANVYRPPGDDDAADRLVTKLLLLDDRYRNTKIIIFGDINYKRHEIQESLRKIEEKGFKILYDKDPDSFTRSQQTIKGLQQSYLDYIMVKNVNNFTMRICDPIGRSDHKSLMIHVMDQ